MKHYTTLNGVFIVRYSVPLFNHSSTSKLEYRISVTITNAVAKVYLPKMSLGIKKLITALLKVVNHDILFQNSYTKDIMSSYALKMLNYWIICFNDTVL